MKRILIADHSEIANRMFCTGLSKCGFFVTAVANVRDLIHQCSIGHYDLLLMDLYLDKTNQLEQILYLKKLCPGLFILVMSDEPDVSSAVQAMKNGADDFIEKPCELNLLTGKIQELLNSEAGWKEKRCREEEEDGSWNSERPVERIEEVVAKVRDYQTTVLITGECFPYSPPFYDDLTSWFSGFPDRPQQARFLPFYG